MDISYSKYTLWFKAPSGTSRGILRNKDSWFITARCKGEVVAVGECSLIDGLSPDPKRGYEKMLQWACNNIGASKQLQQEVLADYPSIRFGLEQLQCALISEMPWVLFPSDFTASKDSIIINGLIWMSDYQNMLSQIIQKINSGFNCIKLKIGAIDFQKELDLITDIKKLFPQKKNQIRVDANGAFGVDCLDKLERLASLGVHSIEQPIKRGQWQDMARLCEQSPLPIALDEELIGISEDKTDILLTTINPHYIIIKPSLLGGFKTSQKWIDKASDMGIGWWVTSALESDIGLNAIAQWTYTQTDKTTPQGLGTGGLYTNNIDSPLYLKGERLFYDNTHHSWDKL